jgi:hypothetical protein
MSLLSFITGLIKPKPKPKPDDKKPVNTPSNAESVNTLSNAGSASTLDGKVYTLSCFISEPGDEWSSGEKTKILKFLKESQEWIQEQALKYNVSVDFIKSGDFGKFGDFGLNKDIKFEKIERGTGSGNESVDWVSKVLYKVGYKSTLTFAEEVRNETKAKNIQVLIFVKGQGTSYAMAMASNSKMEEEKYFVEGAMVYEKYNNGEDLVSATIAHEILHLYGSWDFYCNQTEENMKKIKKLYPDSVMLKVSSDFNELTVDPITAWLIGWNKNPEKGFESFKPVDKKSNGSPYVQK